MGREDKFTIEKAYPVQIRVVTDFIKALYGDDIEDYWKFISEIDKARLYGVHLGSELSFLSLVKESRDKQRAIYEKIKDNYGISDTARYTESGEVIMYLLKDIKVPINFISDTNLMTWRVKLCLDIENTDSTEYHGAWRIRVFEDREHKILITNN